MKINTSMTANSEIILSENTHPGDSTTEILIGNKFKGDGYYGRSDGLHSVQYSYSGLSGIITIQASLVIDPGETDWFNVYEYNASVETGSQIGNFTGNYVWIRAHVSYTDGTINSIVLNH